ncbi:hypothetical protein IWW36_000986 [Coemansia brasiliensis]|uniref:SET domain-containing protein n=1 Tax=Coemansia brasiliensis TaxID=2650707 RepID=A0A9W8M168_9FUNG|nr:hypothetical protein IWW36_000986 [Coemansia brasiliensis]
MAVGVHEEKSSEPALSVAACKILPATDAYSLNDDFDTANCFPVQIKEVAGRGRGFFAARDIAAGETVFRAMPLAWAISEDWIRNTCWWCFTHDCRRPLPIKAAQLVPAAVDSGITNKKPHRQRYKGVFCSEDCMQKAINAHGGCRAWQGYLALLDSIEADVHSHKTKSARTKKQNALSSRETPATVCEVASADIELATFASAANPELVECKPAVNADFDFNDVSDEQLATWISFVWNAIVVNGLYTSVMPNSGQRELVRLIANGLFLEYTASDFFQHTNKVCHQNELSWKRCITSYDAANHSIAPPSALDHMRSNEIDFVRAHLRQLDSSSANSSPLTPATLVPARIPWKPSPLQIEGSWWSAVFETAASSFALLDRAWTASSKVYSLSPLTHDLFRKVYFREMANSFGVYDPPTKLTLLSSTNLDSSMLNSQCEQECVGFCIYPTAVYFNHSCCPNVAKVRSGREMVFVATTPIMQDEEMFISYGCITDPVSERRKRLAENFFFTCDCSRCLVELTALVKQF